MRAREFYPTLSAKTAATIIFRGAAEVSLLIQRLRGQHNLSVIACLSGLLRGGLFPDCIFILLFLYNPGDNIRASLSPKTVRFRVRPCTNKKLQKK